MTWERFQYPGRICDDRQDPVLDDDMFCVRVDGRRYVPLRLAETSGDPQMRRRVDRAGQGRGANATPPQRGS